MAKNKNNKNKEKATSKTVAELTVKKITPGFGLLAG